MNDVQYTTLPKVKAALLKAGDSSVGAWTVKNVVVNEDDLFERSRRPGPTQL